MNYLKWLRLPALPFLLLILPTLLPNSRFIPTAQGQSIAPRLEGTSWQGNTEFELNTGDIMNIEFTYIFSKYGKVELAFLAFISGLDYQRNPYDNTIRSVFNPMKSTFSGSEVCTFKTAGKSIQISCPTTGNIDAITDGNRMRGEITSHIKGVKSKRDSWLLERKSNKLNTPPTKSDIKKPTESLQTPNNTDSSTKLKLGSYKVSGTYTRTANFGTLTGSSAFRIKVESIDPYGNVKAELTQAGDKGQLKGTIDPNGHLRLEGQYKNFLGVEYKFTLEATVRDNALINGRYSEISSRSEIKGIFNMAILEED